MTLGLPGLGSKVVFPSDMYTLLCKKGKKMFELVRMWKMWSWVLGLASIELGFAFRVIRGVA